MACGSPFESGVHTSIAGVLLALTIPLQPAAGRSRAPLLLRWEHALVPWVAFVIVPVFALANAGVVLGGEALDMIRQPVALGVIAGLLVGKQLGITLTVWLVVRSGLATLPSGVTWRQLYGVTWLAAIGGSWTRRRWASWSRPSSPASAAGVSCRTWPRRIDDPPLGEKRQEHAAAGRRMVQVSPACTPMRSRRSGHSPSSCGSWRRSGRIPEGFGSTSPVSGGSAVASRTCLINPIGCHGTVWPM